MLQGGTKVYGRRRELSAGGKLILFIAITIFAAILFSAVFAGSGKYQQNQNAAVTGGTENGIEIEIEKNKNINDSNINVFIGGKINTMDLEDYITGVVAAEMPVSYEPEALKAQAVASRTYAVYLKEHGGCKDHPGADVAADSSSCQAYITQDQMAKRWGNNKDTNLKKIRGAVDATKGQLIYYKGKVIESLFFACSGGRTEDCANVFSESLPYLVSVESGGEEGFSNYYGEVSLTPDEFVKAMKNYSPSITINKNNIASGIGDIVRSKSNRVESIKIGNESFTGREIRSVFSLNSTNFTVSVTDKITFKTVGFGHGVGMSQDGADAMAKSGADYTAILKHYYTGVNIQ